jgi:UDP-N-acetylmuramoylalanine--D-glutamate ligase
MLNALAGMAIGHVVGFDITVMLKAIANFDGLEHRCQRVATKSQVDYFNDSKGTNVGATVAALEGLGATLGHENKIVLIAGGDGKGASFEKLAKPVAQYVKNVVLIGVDAKRLGAAIPGAQLTFSNSLQEAVYLSASLAVPGDIVLLSPACASFDMFDNYEQRGHVFTAAAVSL